MERSQGSGSAACVRFWRWGPEGSRGKAGLLCLPQGRGFLWQVSPTHTGMGPEGVQGKGRHSRQWRLSMPAFLNRNKRRNAAPIEVAERPESPLVASAEAKPFAIREGKVGPFLACRKKAVFLWQVPPTHTGMGPEGVQGAIGKPPGRLRRGETLCDTGKER